MASHLGRTVAEAQLALSSTQFLDWIWFLDWKATEEFKREDYYMAQIAACIERGHVKNPRSVTLKKMLIDFSPKKKSTEQRLQNSKSMWLNVTGIIGGNKNNRRKRPLPKSLVKGES